MEQNLTRAPQPIAAEGFTFVIDMGDTGTLPALELPLRLRCRTCRRIFHSDFEEKECARCVALRELPAPSPATV